MVIFPVSDPCFASGEVHRRDKALTPTFGSEAARPLHPAAAPKGSGSGDLVKNILQALGDSKAIDTVSIDLAGKTSIADVMLITSGSSNTHVGAIAERVIKAAKEAGVEAPRVEGLPHCDWVLVDAGDVLVHIFRPEVRLFYNLEKLWGGDRPVEASAEVRRAM